MPPKKKGGAKGKKGGGQGNIIDGISTAEMTREQLEKFALRIREECEREREERNFFQIERDKLRSFWELAKDQLEELRAAIRNKDREIEEANEKNAEEIKHLKQKVKHLMYENQNSLAELRAEAMVSLKLAQDDHAAQESELLKDKINLKEKIREQEIAAQEKIKAIRLAHSEEINIIRKKLENTAIEIEFKFDERLKTIREEFDVKNTVELNEIEERKNRQIAELMKNHEEAFKEIKSYYNDITLNNLALISSLKEQTEHLTKQCEKMEKQVVEVNAENKKLFEPLKQAQAENKELQRKLQNYEKDKTSLHNKSILLNSAQKSLEELRWENEALELKFDVLKKDHEQLKGRFIAAILDVQQKTSLKNVLLQKKMQEISEELERKDVTLSEMAAAAQLAPDAINKKLEELLRRKNTIIQDLQYEISRITKAHDDLLETYEAKLKLYGISTVELGFTPLRITRPTAKRLGKGPAGLITRNK